ncbi:hypothetical protein G9Q97_11520 [Cyclobacterium sp. GBPx2]|uniref:CHRD domain-containing protein n=2 Tax=Cyclobacterium plantarum TaxID=2716263 RepID=A0ABX0HAL7_9BACT|nr:hypothetical protein [Cyclobacterium plantarum]
MKNMKINFLFALVLLGFISCQPEENLVNDVGPSYDLYQSSDFNFEGKATFQVLANGEVELLVQLFGDKSNDPYFYTGHLHFGSFDQGDAPIAHALNPIDSRTLESRTVLGKLSNGKEFDLEAINDFDGHIKVHLADQGPDYNIILVSGNIGRNDNSREAFNAEQLTLCSPYFPAESF